MGGPDHAAPRGSTRPGLGDYVALQEGAREDENWLYHPKFPHDWKRCSLYSLAQWVNGLAFRNIEFGPAGKPVIKITEIKGGISDQTKFTQQGFDESVRIRPGDLLFSWSGQPETSIDAFWWRGPEGWLNQHIFRVTVGPDLDKTFFYYLLRYLKPNFIGIARNKQTTGLGHVTKRDLQSIEVAFPPLDAQRAIARVLGALDDKIELNRRMSATLEAMARALFKSWFVDFEPVRAKMEGRPSGLPPALDALFPASFEASELGQIPSGWGVGTLGDVLDVNPRIRIRRGDVATHVEMAALPTSGPHVAEWTRRPFTSGSRFTRGDTLLARITPSLENGKTALVDFLDEGETGWGSTEFIVLRPKPPWPPELAYVMAREPDFREHAIVNMTGTSGRQRVPADAVSAYPLAMAPDSVAVAFGEFVRPWFKCSTHLSRQSRDLAAQRDTLLPRLVSGEVRVGSGETACA